jgi:hypothetical protein
MKSTCVALLVLVVAGCGCENCGGTDAKGSGVVARLDDRHTLVAPVTVGNLTVWPVTTDRPFDLGEFLTLEEALAKGAAEVREVGAPEGAAQSAQVQVVGVPIEEPAAQSRERAPAAQQEAAQTLEEASQELELVQLAEGAVVNTLVVENKGDLPILVCAGTVVKGGKQDRQIGQDFVLKAKTTTPVDAFCVEQGRWTSDRLGEETGGKFQVLDGMATAKVRAKGQYEKDQGGVWQEVAVVNATPTNPPLASAGQPILQAAGLLATSSSFAVAFDRNAAASADDLKRCEDAVKKHFTAHEDAVGFAYAINGEPVTVRTFAHPRLLQKQLDDFVRGMATEALLAKTDAPAKPCTAADVVALVKQISAASETVAGTAGINFNGLRKNDAGYNGNCYLEDKDGKRTAVTQDWTRK